MTQNDGSNPASFLEREPEFGIRQTGNERPFILDTRKKRIALAIGKLFATRKCPTFGEIADVAILEYEREDVG